MQKKTRKLWYTTVSQIGTESGYIYLKSRIRSRPSKNRIRNFCLEGVYWIVTTNDIVFNCYRYIVNCNPASVT